MQTIFENQGVVGSASLCFKLSYLDFVYEVVYPDIIRYFPEYVLRNVDIIL